MTTKTILHSVSYFVVCSSVSCSSLGLLNIVHSKDLFIEVNAVPLKVTNNHFQYTKKTSYTNTFLVVKRQNHGVVKANQQIGYRRRQLITDRHIFRREEKMLKWSHNRDGRLSSSVETVGKKGSNWLKLTFNNSLNIRYSNWSGWWWDLIMWRSCQRTGEKEHKSSLKMEKSDQYDKIHQRQ